VNEVLGKWPGVVKTYDGPTRTATVAVEGITDGSTDLPEAVFCYAIGDRSLSDNGKEPTEILVKPGDLVWIEFEAGDPRFPIIVGFRTPRQGNSTGWRRYHHANIEMTADGQYIINCDQYIVNANTAKINAVVSTTITGPETTVESPVTQVNGALGVDATANGGAGTVDMVGAVSTTGTLTNNGANVGASHVHNDPQGGT
jgi:hypothetical protein